MAVIPLPSGLSKIYTFLGTDQAAGTEVSEVVPPSKWWLLLALSVTCAQGLTQTPFPSLVIADAAGNTIFQGFAGAAAINASVTSRCTWAPGLAGAGGGAQLQSLGPLPDGLLLPAGYTLKTVTTGIGANTNYGVPAIHVCELG